MNSSELKDKIQNLTIWKRGDERAPHKPLLILLALGQLQSKEKRHLAYEEIQGPLKNLLIEFGPNRQSYHPEQPFVRLAKDGLWKLNTAVSDRNIRNRWLLEHEVVGGFSEEVYSLLKVNDNLIREVAEIILHNHFPDSIHEDILDTVGLELETKRVRDPKFRNRVLQAYEYSCAVCGFNVRLENTLIAVQAAHIKWYQAGGPDTEDNGIALCAMHHKLFDRGVFTLTTSGKLLVAERAHGNKGFDEWLMRYHGKQIKSPVRPSYYPKDSFIDWHVREVFRGPARYASGCTRRC